MTVKVEVKGVPEVMKRLNRISDATRKEVLAGIDYAGQIGRNEVMDSIAGRGNELRSVDTGRFLNSVETHSFIEGNDAGVEIFSKVEYAEHLEYGTTTMKPRRHFRNSRDRIAPKIREKILERIQKVVK